MIEKHGAITEDTPDVDREDRPDKQLRKEAQFRDAARTLKDSHKPNRK